MSPGASRMKDAPWYEHAARVGALLAVLTPLVYMAKAMGGMEARLEEITRVVTSYEARFQAADRRIAEVEARMAAEEASERTRAAIGRP